MKFNKIIRTFTIALFLFQLCKLDALAQVRVDDLRVPVDSSEIEENIPTKIDLSKVPSFVNPFKKASVLYRIDSSTNSFTVNLDSRLRIELDTNINPKEVAIGDYIKAHVLEDFYLPTNPEWLIIPKGSWIRGSISYVKKPSLFSRSSKIKVRMDQLTTPTGEIVPLSAEFNIKQGIVGADGYLVPVEVEEESYKDKASVDTPVTVSIDEVDSKVINKFLDGYLNVLYFPSSGDVLYDGKELQVVLKKDLLFVKN